MQLAHIDRSIVVKGMDVTKATLAHPSEAVNNLTYNEFAHQRPSGGEAQFKDADLYIGFFKE